MKTSSYLVRPLLIFLLLLSSNSSIGQASWTYTLNFTLSDHQGNKIDSTNFDLKGVQLYHQTHSGFVKFKLNQNKKSGSYEFWEHTIYTDAKLVLLTNTDTMYIEISTHTADIGEIQIKNGFYKVPLWTKSAIYDCTPQEDGCILKKKLNSFKKTEKPNWEFSLED